MELYRCSACKKRLPRYEYNYDAAQPDKRRRRCTKCNHERWKQWSAKWKNPDIPKILAAFREEEKPKPVTVAAAWKLRQQTNACRPVLRPAASATPSAANSAKGGSSPAPG